MAQVNLFVLRYTVNAVQLLLLGEGLNAVTIEQVKISFDALKWGRTVVIISPQLRPNRGCQLRLRARAGPHGGERYAPGPLRPERGLSPDFRCLGPQLQHGENRPHNGDCIVVILSRPLSPAFSPVGENSRAAGSYVSGPPCFG